MFFIEVNVAQKKEQKSKFYLILKVGETPLYFFLTLFNVFYIKRKEDMSGNLCLPNYYSHSPMKKDNNYR